MLLFLSLLLKFPVWISRSNKVAMSEFWASNFLRSCIRWWGFFCVMVNDTTGYSWKQQNFRSVTNFIGKLLDTDPTEGWFCLDKNSFMGLGSQGASLRMVSPVCNLLNNLEPIVPQKISWKNRIQSSVNDFLGTVGEITDVKREVNTGKNTALFKKSEAAAPRPSWSQEGKLLFPVEAFGVLGCILLIQY